MKISCVIRTPQFKERKIHHYHTQRGLFDTDTLLFEPYRNMFGQWSGGDHSVKFNSMDDWEKSRIDNIPERIRNWISIRKAKDCLFSRRNGYIGKVICGYSVCIRLFNIDIL